MPSIKQYLEALRWAGIKIEHEDAKKFASVFFCRTHSSKQVDELYVMVLNERKPGHLKTPYLLNQKLAKKHKSLMREAERFWSSSLAKMDYQEFLKTPYWMTVRHIKMLEVGDKCESCEVRFGLQIHHLSYEARGRDHARTDLLTVLCEQCHRKRHRIK